MRMKKKRHGIERLSLLSELLCENTSEFVKNKSTIYKNNNPLRVEIGCGKGDFIRGKSIQESNYNYLAIEKISDVCVVAAEKYAVSRGLGSLAPNGGWQKSDGTVVPLGMGKVDFSGQELGNVRFFVGDAKEALSALDENTIDTIYINFCDPWSKKGYAKRRLTHKDFLNMYSKILIDGGKLCFKTDNSELFEFSLEEIKNSNFELEYCTYDLHASDMNNDNIVTEYERNFSEKGFKINMLIANNKK